MEMCCLCRLSHHYQQHQKHNRKICHLKVTAASLRVTRNMNQPKNYGMYDPHFYICGKLIHNILVQQLLSSNLNISLIENHKSSTQYSENKGNIVSRYIVLYDTEVPVIVSVLASLNRLMRSNWHRYVSCYSSLLIIGQWNSYTCLKPTV